MMARSYYAATRHENWRIFYASRLFLTEYVKEIGMVLLPLALKPCHVAVSRTSVTDARESALF